MKQSIQLRLGQTLTMTPQLQQAIRLLQLSSLELNMEVQQALESNPMLELSEEGDEDDGDSRDQNSREIADANGESSANRESVETPEQRTEREDTDNPEAGTAMEESAIPDDLPVDTAWDDIYDQIPTYGQLPDYNGREFEVHAAGTESLHDHLQWQMRLTPFSDADAAIANAIIDSIDEDGYLTATLEDLQQSIGDDLEDVGVEEIEAVLHQVQNFDPAGVGARDLAECLRIQLKQIDFETPWREPALRLVREHLGLLAAHDYAQLMRRMKLGEDELQQVVALIRSLNPRPGGQISSERTEYIVPDVVVRKIKGVWKVELNADAAPRLRINSHYANLIKRADNSNDNTYLKNQLQEARWFLKSLQSRNETLLKVATCIVERQRDFLDHGEEAMKALVLHDIAEAVDMHESTISRVTTRKYMHTPRGIYELKYFFSSHVSTASGGECSSTAIRAFIKKLVASEDPKKPLSDSKIASVLAEQGINVARRTVAKYREAMSLPPSNERKRLM